MPKRYQRPVSSQRLSHLSASRPARNEKTMPSRLESRERVKVDGSGAVARCAAFQRRIASRADDGGRQDNGEGEAEPFCVLLSAAPVSMPMEMVEPERENPRKGKREPLDDAHPAGLPYCELALKRSRGRICAG